MKLFFLKFLKYNFSFDFFQKLYISPFYYALLNKTNKKEVINPNFKSIDAIGNVIHEIKFIPPYFNLDSEILDSTTEVIKYYRVENFKVNLEPFLCIDDYLNDQLGPKNRKQLRTKTRRLETCFNIKYVFYYGDISEQDYELLFKKLVFLIERRFNQRGDLFSLKDKFSTLKQQSYKLILDKKAYLFVIYDEKKPISIELSFLFQNICQSLITSYDIDYSKFGIGNISNFKMIDWCFSNNFKMIDLMWGKLPSKTLWANDIQLYEHQFIYKNRLLNNFFVHLMIKMYRTNDALKEKLFYKFLIKTKTSASLYFQFIKRIQEPIISVENITKMPLSEKISKININNESYKFLRKTVYDFQYLNFENSAHVEVFKIHNHDNLFIIKGSKSQMKATLNYE